MRSVKATQGHGISPPALIICTHLPPPVDGMAFASQKIIGALRNSGAELRVYDISGDQRDILYHPKRILRAIRATVVIVSSPRRFAWVYMPVNAGVGLIYNILLATFARLTGRRVILHHHSFAYIDNRNRGVALLQHISGSAAIQIMLCDCMHDKLEQAYGKAENCINLPSAFYSRSDIKREAAPKGRDDRTLTFGHLSNLSIEKGLDDCIALHRALVGRGDRVKLVIGGPCSTAAAKQVLDNAQVEFPESLAYLGPLDERAKDAFYKLTDVFLFPTRYRNEADPIVVSDAQAYGLATIVVSRGCLGERVDDVVGIAVPRASDFVQTVLKRIPDFESLREFAESRGQAAMKRHIETQSSADASFVRLLQMLQEGKNT